MKDRGKDDYDDDFESEEEDIIVVKTKKKPRAVTATAGRLQGPKRSSTMPARRSGSAVNKARAMAGHKKSPRELWLNSLKNGAGGLSTGQRKTGHPGKRTPVEYWMDALRKTGEGRSTESTRMNTFGGPRPDQAGMAYMSTSHYLRQMTGAEKGKKSPSEPTGKSAGRKPAYKSQEEYYDEILDLKKHIVKINNENTHMKSKLRRVEEDNAKKDKEIEQLLNPSKSEDMRRTLGDRKPESGAVIHSLKQRILRLEQQLKEKEASYKKLQSDIKATKIEETNIQVEAFYAEIVRLQSIVPSKSKSTPSKPQLQVKDSSPKIKALNETVFRLNEHNNRLQLENKALKEDLSRQLEKSSSSKEKEKVAEGYKDMNKKELMEAVSRLEKRLEKAEGDTVSILSGLESRQGDHEGKVLLEGTIAQRLDQLDKRETELLHDKEKLQDAVKRLREDKAHFRRKCEEKDKEIKSLRKEIEDLHADLDAARADPDRSTKAKVKTPSKKAVSSRVSTGSGETVARARRMSDESIGSKTHSKLRDQEKHAQRRTTDEEAERKRRIEEFEQKRAAKAIQRSWKGHKQSQAELDEMRHREKRVEDFTTNRAARQIQKHWRGHQDDKDDATTLIQSTLRGHKARKQQMRNFQRDDDDDEEDDGDSDEAALLIQSAYRGHSSRKAQMKRTGSPQGSYSKGGRPSSAKHGIFSSGRTALDSEGESVDDDSTYSGSIQSSARSSFQPKSPAKRTGSAASSQAQQTPGVRTSPFRRSPLLLKNNDLDDDDDDDDDDIIF